MAAKSLRYLLAFLLLILGASFVLWRLQYGPRKPLDSSSELPSLLGRPLRVAIVSWPGYAGGIVANNGFSPNRNCLYWTDHHLEVEFKLIEDNNATAKAFANASVDIIWTTVDSWANQFPNFSDGGVNAKAILQVDWSRGGDAIVADDNIRTIEDLKGKRIALSLLTPSHWFLESKLMSSHLTDRDRAAIEKTIVGKTASPDARVDFVAKKVDAAVVWEPDVTQALKERKGSHILASTLRDQNLLADLMAAQSEFIAQHSDVMQAFVSGWLSGTTLADSNRDHVAQLLVNNEPLYRDLGVGETRRQLSSVKWADKQDNTAMFGLDGQTPLFDELYTRAAQLWLKLGYIKRVIPAVEARDIAFVKKAVTSE